MSSVLGINMKNKDRYDSSETEEININGKTILSVKSKYNIDESEKEQSDSFYYWNENGVYYCATISNTDGYHDEIAEEFINSKNID